MGNVRLAVRSLVRTPAFTLTTAVSLAFGLTLTASTIAVVNAYLERSLPYADAARIHHLMYAPPGPWEPRGMERIDWTTLSDVIEHPIGAVGENVTTTGGGFATSLRALRVAPGFAEGPNQDAIGQPIRVIEQTPDGLTPRPWRTIVGVAADVRQRYDDPNRANFYTPKIPDGRYGSFYLRTTGSGVALLKELRTAAAVIDPEAIISDPRAVISDDNQLAGATLLGGLLSAFAAGTLFLSILGIYGITAYTVQQRRHEVAIRIALGAADAAIMRMFLRHGATLLGAGTLMGLAGSVVLSRVLEHQVFGVRSFDALVTTAGALVLLSAGIVAVWWPARRLAGVSPAMVLRGD